MKIKKNPLSAGDRERERERNAKQIIRNRNGEGGNS